MYQQYKSHIQMHSILCVCTPETPVTHKPMHAQICLWHHYKTWQYVYSQCCMAQSIQGMLPTSPTTAHANPLLTNNSKTAVVWTKTLNPRYNPKAGLAFASLWLSSWEPWKLRLSDQLINLDCEWTVVCKPWHCLQLCHVIPIKTLECKSAQEPMQVPD